jgi:hypothetical protein
MALTIKNESNGGGYESLPVGQYKAACYRIVDVGTHNETYEGKPASVTAFLFTGKPQTIKCRMANPFLS